MKFLSVILTISVCVFLGVQSAPTSNLLGDLIELNELFYRDEIKQLVKKYYENDPEVRKIFQYLGSPEVTDIAHEFIESPEVVEFSKWLGDKIKSSQSMIPDNESDDDEQFTGGWNAFVQNFLRIFSIEKYHEKVEELKARDNDFAELIDRIAALKPVYDELIQRPEVIEVGRKLESMGVNVRGLNAFLREMNGWN